MFSFYVNYVNVVNGVEGSWSGNYGIIWRDLENILLNNINSYCAGIEGSDGAKALATGMKQYMEVPMVEWTHSESKAYQFSTALFSNGPLSHWTGPLRPRMNQLRVDVALRNLKWHEPQS